ncbi:MAG: ATPase, T2SS/T4P/T4SS family, partial [Phycisphaerae bacterium]|nr:ATPase, T2SS/T4P/T4SS family [Phycisphaerae bacterium]
MARKKRRRLGEILVDWGVVTDTAVKEALEHAKSEGIKIGEALVALEAADPEEVTKALANQFDMEYIDLDANVVVPSQLDLIDENLIRRHQILPLEMEEGLLKVIITDPLDLETLDMLRFRLNCELETCLASSVKTREFIRRYIGATRSIDEAFSDLGVGAEADGEEGADGELTEASAPIIRLVAMLLTEAVNSRASDIHIEPMANRVRVRYRTDGVCVVRDDIPKRTQGSVLNRVKIMAGIDLAEKRLPQDGRIKMTIAGNDIDFRVSSLPSYYGESIVLRILRPESVRMGIPALGFEQEDYEQFQKIIKKPNGIFLVTGPTGSGKTTTLYAAINELNRPDRKIITAEDPVEYNFTRVNQVQVN